MIDIHQIIHYGTVLSLIGSFIILFSLYLNPRLWLQDYPKEIQRKVEPKTKQEKRQALHWGIPFLIVLFAMPFLSAWTVRHQDSASGSFLSLFLSAFGVALFFNIVDLLVIDYLIFCFWTPRFIIIPGTEGMDAYHDYGHHFRAFIVGTVVSLSASVLIAAIIKLIRFIT